MSTTESQSKADGVDDAHPRWDEAAARGGVGSLLVGLVVVLAAAGYVVVAKPFAGSSGPPRRRR